MGTTFDKDQVPGTKYQKFHFSTYPPLLILGTWNLELAMVLVLFSFRMPLDSHVLIDILPVFIFNQLEIIGFYTACWYKQADTEDHEPIEESKMVLWKVKFYCLKWLGEFYSKPICTCPPCMSSLHSLIYWLFMPLTLQSLIIYPIYILALCGSGKLLVEKFDL